jgi:type II secretory ATPase GspE/PulE/Tfp pilus assembly ATPase PilB-like protein
MSDKICPRCKEKNSHNAMMCWACNTELVPLSSVWKAAARLGIEPYARVLHARARVLRESRQARERDPIARIFDTILMYGAKDGASEICIEPQEKGITVFYRINGELHDQVKMPAYILLPLVSHIKNVGKMEILDAEHPTEQQGSVHFALDDHSYNWSVSTQATAFGEKVVLSVRS